MCANIVRRLKFCDRLTDSSPGICILAAQRDTSDVQLHVCELWLLIHFKAILHHFSMFISLFSHPERNPHRTVLQGLQWENQRAEGGHPSPDQDPREGASARLVVGLANPSLTLLRLAPLPPTIVVNSTSCITLPKHFHYSYSTTEVSLSICIH